MPALVCFTQLSVCFPSSWVKVTTGPTRARSAWSIWRSRLSSFRKRWTSCPKERKSTWCRRYRYGCVSKVFAVLTFLPCYACGRATDNEPLHSASSFRIFDRMCPDRHTVRKTAITVKCNIYIHTDTELLWWCVCLCVSVTLMYCAQTTESIIMRRSQDCNLAILVFPYQKYEPDSSKGPRHSGCQMGEI